MKAYVYFREFLHDYNNYFGVACKVCTDFGFNVKIQTDHMHRRECWLFVATLEEAHALNGLIRESCQYRIEVRAGTAGL